MCTQAGHVDGADSPTQCVNALRIFAKSKGPKARQSEKPPARQRAKTVAKTAAERENDTCYHCRELGHWKRVLAQQ